MKVGIFYKKKNEFEARNNKKKNINNNFINTEPRTCNLKYIYTSLR